MTKFGRILRYWPDDINHAAKLTDCWTVIQEDLGTSWSCFLVLSATLPLISKIILQVILIANYYSFQRCLCFWLAKITHIIHHNQLLLTKFGRILWFWTNDINHAAKLPDYWYQNRSPRTSRRSWVVWVIQNGGTFLLDSQGRNRQMFG